MQATQQPQAGYHIDAFTITALTNMHVGSGKNNYAVIDNLVQRDVLNGMPTINASSLKGALRQYFEVLHEGRKIAIRDIFGADSKTDDPSQGGAYIFMAAHLLSIPVRSDKRPFFRATAPTLIHDFLRSAESFGLELSMRQALEAFAGLVASTGKAKHFLAELGRAQVVLEDLELMAEYQSFEQLSEVESLLGNSLALIPDELFRNLVNDENLPIVARNSLENGISQNLWYEQILPRQTRFAAMVLSPKGNTHHSFFVDELEKKPVQIGANASIGYGFCELKTIR